MSARAFIAATPLTASTSLDHRKQVLLRWSRHRCCHSADLGQNCSLGMQLMESAHSLLQSAAAWFPPCSLSLQAALLHRMCFHSFILRSLAHLWNPLKPSMRSLSADLWTATRGQDPSGHKLSIQPVCLVWGVSKERHYRGSN